MHQFHSSIAPKLLTGSPVEPNRQLEILERAPTRVTRYRVTIERKKLELDLPSQMQREPPNDPGRP
jgi:hypothetical protein